MLHWFVQHELVCVIGRLLQYAPRGWRTGFHGGRAHMRPKTDRNSHKHDEKGYRPEQRFRQRSVEGHGQSRALLMIAARFLLGDRAEIG